MSEKRQIEIFSAGCPVCQEAIDLVNKLACQSCQVEVLDINHPDIVEKAKQYGVKSVPAVAVDGELASCCKNGNGPSEQALKEAGIGQLKSCCK